MNYRLSSVLLAALISLSIVAGCAQAPEEVVSGSQTAPSQTGGSSKSEENSMVNITGLSSGFTTESAAPTRDTGALDSATRPVPGTSRTAGDAGTGQTAAKTTAKAITASSTSKPAVKLPLSVEWLIKASLEYETIEPTYDGKNWVAYKGYGKGGYDLIDTAGKVVLSGGDIDIDGNHPDRIIVKKGDWPNTQYSMADTSGNMIVPFQNKSLLFYGEVILKEKSTENYTFVIIDKDGKELGDYNGDVGYGSVPDDSYLLDRKTSTVYYSKYCLENGNDMDYFYDTQETEKVSDCPKKLIAIVGDILPTGDSTYKFKIQNPLGFGVVVDGQLKSTKFYPSLYLLKTGNSWERDLYHAGTGSGENRRYGLTNAAGEVIYPLEFESLASNDNCNAAAVKQNGKWGFVKLPAL